jgi:non-heme chloroperoxidase
MKSINSVALATWMLEHLTFGSDNEALSGDLLEELQLGRSALWYWRQVLTTIAIRAGGAARKFAVPVVFSVGWAMLYPTWRFITEISGVHVEPDQGTWFTWPSSAMVQIGYGVVPGVLFVWVGFLIFLLFRAGAGTELREGELLRGLSQSLTVFFLSTILLLFYLRHPQVDLACVTRSDFYTVFHLCNISIPIALSVLASVLASVPRPSRNHRRRRDLNGPMLSRVRRVVQAFCLILSLSLVASAQTISPAPVQFVAVSQDVRLEVLDWGGTGRPMIFLSGLGDTAHDFEGFAKKFTANYHVYGITRRGFGASSKPAPEIGNYSADRLGDDVLAVIDALRLDRPIVVGHSIAGEELSSIGSRHPERVAGLIYLDAAFPYAYYNHANSEWTLDMVDVRKQIEAFQAGAVLEPRIVEEMSGSVELLEKDLRDMKKELAMFPPPYPPPPPPIGLAIKFGEQKYTQIPVPILAVVACPHNFDDLKDKPKIEAALVAEDSVRCTAQVDAFEAGVPSAHVVRLRNADHYVFKSNESDVIREMNAFLAGLH